MKVCDMTNEEALELYKIAYFVCDKYNFPNDEDMIQDMVLGACERLSMYDESKSAKTTFLCKVMTNAALIILRKTNAKKRISECKKISFDSVVCEGNRAGDDKTLLDIIPSDIDISEDLNRKEILDHIEPLLEAPLILWMNGKDQKDIAEIIGVSQPQISREIKANIEKIRNYCKKNNLCY